VSSASSGKSTPIPRLAPEPADERRDQRVAGVGAAPGAQQLQNFGARLPFGHQSEAAVDLPVLPPRRECVHREVAEQQRRAEHQRVEDQRGAVGRYHHVVILTAGSNNSAGR
jgi:hypothetical protein